MATSRARTTSGVPTRQQLDELDALLQRMLALPVVAPAEDEEPVSAPVAVAAPEEEPAPARPIAPYNPPHRNLAARLSTEVQEEAEVVGYPDPPSPDRFAPVRPQVSRPLERPLSQRPITAERTRLEPVMEEPKPPVERPREPRPETPPPVDASWMSGPYPASYMVVQTVTPLMPEPPPPVAEAPAQTGPAFVPEPIEAEGEWVPLRSAWQPSAQTWKPLADSWAKQHDDSTVPQPAPEPQPAPWNQLPSATPPQVIPPAPTEAPEVPVMPPPVFPPMARVAPPVHPQPFGSAPAIAPEPTASPEPTIPTTAEEQPERYPLILAPIVAFNVVFDFFLGLWGAPGRFFCARIGRAFLAMIGLLCLIAAGVLAVGDWMGWTW
jgi:hypothetical protein